jgi:divalent metal cation (Fe/Co/Zn/Cd) transporter
MPDYAALRRGIVLINQWLLVPSLLIVLVSGLLAIAATEAYKNAGWAWVKALTGILMFEGTLLTVVSSGRQAAEITTAAAASGASAESSARLAELLRTEWGGLWIMLGLCLANIVLAIWRPRLGRRVQSASQPAD